MVTGPLSIARQSLTDLLRVRKHVKREKILKFEDTVAEAYGVYLAALERRQDAVESRANARRERMRRQEAGTVRSGMKYALDPGEEKALLDTEAEAEATLAHAISRYEDANAHYQTERRNLDRLREFLSATSPGAIIAAAATTPPKGATLESIRAEIRTKEDEAEAARAAPLPRAELIRAIEAEVDALATRGAPSINARARNGDPAGLARRLALGIQGSSLIGDAGAHFFIWLARDEIKARLADLIPDLPGALTDAQRDRKLADLAVEKLRLERIEEAIIEQAESEGRKVQRRPDASPEAVLCIEVKEARP